MKGKLDNVLSSSFAADTKKTSEAALLSVDSERMGDSVKVHISGCEWGDTQGQVGAVPASRRMSRAPWLGLSWTLSQPGEAYGPFLTIIFVNSNK